MNKLTNIRLGSRKMLKRLVSWICVLAVAFSLCATVFADGAPVSQLPIVTYLLDGNLYTVQATENELVGRYEYAPEKCGNIYLVSLPYGASFQEISGTVYTTSMTSYGRAISSLDPNADNYIGTGTLMLENEDFATQNKSYPYYKGFYRHCTITGTIPSEHVKGFAVLCGYQGTAGNEYLDNIYDAYIIQISTAEESPTAESIRISGEFKTEYTIGDMFDQTGIVVTAEMSDGTEMNVTADTIFTGFNSETAGEKTVTAVYGNLTATFKVTVTEVEPEEPSVKVDEASLTLEGDIGVNFYVIPNAALLADKDAYAQFTYKGDTGDPIRLDKVTPSEGKYCFTQFVAAKEMTEQITLKFYTGSGVPVALTNSQDQAIDGGAAIYSVARYIANANANAKTLAGRLGSYGYCAKTYFNNTIVAEDTDYVSNVAQAEDIYEVSVDTLDSFRTSKEGSVAGINVSGVSLTLKSLTTLNISFTTEEGYTLSRDNITVKADGTDKAFEIEQSGNKAYIHIVNIPAKELDTKYTVTIGGENGLTLTCSALSYARNVLKTKGSSTETEDMDLCNLVKSVYQYNAVANDYFR